MHTELEIDIRREAIDKPDIRIEEAVPEDVDAVHDLLLAESANNTVLPRTKDVIAAVIASPHDKLFVYRDGGIARGSVILEYYDPRWLAELRSLAVDQRYRGRKIGEALVRQAVDHLRASGVDQAYTTTNIPGFFEKPAFGFSKKHKGQEVVWRHETDETLIYAPFMKHLQAIRPATEDDRDAVIALCRQARATNEMTDTDVQRLHHFFPTMLVHEENGEIDGCINYRTFNDRMAQMDELFVRPDRQGQGIGSALFFKGRQLTEHIPRAFAVTDKREFAARVSFHPEETGKSIRWLNP